MQSQTQWWSGATAVGERWMKEGPTGTQMDEFSQSQLTLFFSTVPNAEQTADTNKIIQRAKLLNQVLNLVRSE